MNENKTNINWLITIQSRPTSNPYKVKEIYLTPLTKPCKIGKNYELNLTYFIYKVSKNEYKAPKSLKMFFLYIFDKVMFPANPIKKN